MVSLKEITLTNICLSLATGTCAVGASKELKRTTRRRHRDTTAELAGPGVLVKVCSCLERRFLSLCQWKCKSWPWVRRQTPAERPRGSLCRRTPHIQQKSSKNLLSQRPGFSSIVTVNIGVCGVLLRDIGGGCRRPPNRAWRRRPSSALAHVAPTGTSSGH